MAISGQINSVQKYDGLAITGFVLGLMTSVFPVISIIFLVAENGGPGYLQSLFCGIPVAFLGILAGVASLARRRTKNQKGGWMAMSGIVLGGLFFVTFWFMIFILISPFLSGTAH
jgi:hypothetical protein